MIVQFWDAETCTKCLTWSPKRRPKYVFKTDNCLMQVKSIAECSSPWTKLCLREGDQVLHECDFTLCPLGNVHVFFFSSADFFQNLLFHKILSGILSECQTDLIQIRTNILLGLIWVQTVCKSYQQMTLKHKDSNCWRTSGLPCAVYDARLKQRSTC